MSESAMPRAMRRTTGTARVALLGLLLAPAPARAQSTAELLALKARTEAELASFDRRSATEAKAAATAAPAPAAKPAPAVLDTLRVEGVSVVVTHDAASLVRSAVAGMAADVRRAFGDAGGRTLARTSVLASLRIFPNQTARVQRGALSLVVRVDTTNLSLPQDPWPADSADVARNFGLAISRALHASLDAGIRSWVSPPRAPGRDSAVFSERAFRLAVATGSSAVRRCLAGDDSACVSTLGLTTVADPLHAWYDAGDYPDVVKALRNLRGMLEHQLGTGTWLACTSKRERDACAAAVAIIPATAYQPPMPDDARVMLLFAALERGGAGAFDRLVADSASPPLARLARTAGVSPAELLDAWRARLTISRPQKAMPTPAILAVALAWIAGAFALSLRNTPWN